MRSWHRYLPAAAFGAALALLMPVRAEAALGVNYGYCTYLPQAHEGFARSISRCELLVAQMGDDLPEHRAAGYYSLAQLYHFDRQYDKAVENYSKAIGWRAQFPAALTARGDAYIALGKKDLAEQDHMKAAVLWHPSAADSLQLCWLRAMRGGPFDLALADCNIAVAAMPGDASALFSRCVVEYRMQSFAPAVADCDAAVKTGAKLTGALYLRGLAKQHAGDAAGGDADIRDVTKLSPKIADGYALFGVGP
jgi:tetratricopeptide (TPR) repeat protein